MNEVKKRFVYLEGNKATFFIIVTGLFVWNFFGGANIVIESVLPVSDSLLLVIPAVIFITIYILITGLGGLFIILIVINDIVDSLFESRNKDNPNYKTQKTVILSLIIGMLAVWFFVYFEPRQECIKNITLSGASVYKYTNKDIEKGFKSRNDALDYCMAQNWGF